ncbi:MAG: radical SAM protein [Proteobacteria bacterium]|nr:radical SAM protein [Pseudomonadota bacterium]
MQEFEKIDDIAKLGFSEHPRLSEYRRLVYPVVSRRAGGLSLGININPDKKCTFDCVYCQVDRDKKITGLSVEVDRIVEELEWWLKTIVEEGGVYQGFPLKDISIAGDGEPTTFKALPELIQEVITTKRRFGLDQCGIVLFTNGSRIDRQDLRNVFPDFFANHGDIWFKLDYWNERSLKEINRTRIPAERLLENLIKLGREYPLTLQSCFFSWKGEKFEEHLYQEYIEFIRTVVEKGVKIKRIQAYTLARVPTDSRAVPWSDREMDRLCRYLRHHLPVDVENYYEKGKET